MRRIDRYYVGGIQNGVFVSKERDCDRIRKIAIERESEIHSPHGRLRNRRRRKRIRVPGPEDMVGILNKCLQGVPVLGNQSPTVLLGLRDCRPGNERYARK
jgi:hypothetical protein